MERGVSRTPQISTVNLLADALALDGEARERFLSVARGKRRHASPAEPRQVLPYVDPILGRQEEIAAADRLFAAGNRLVTLLGPGGVGKTRLARALADWWETGRPGSMVWVALESLQSPDSVIAAVARALGINAAADQSLASAIAENLTGQRTLIVLDNFEHLVVAAPSVAALLANTPGLSILVTSREALRLRGECILIIDPLPIPAPGASAADRAANPAVALFERTLTTVSRARDSGGAQATDLDHAARIVRLLDGLPLAIELAAAQGATLHSSTIATLLETAGLAALAHGRRDDPARFQTMDAAIAWSADLLSPDAQRLFRLLGAFRGGFTTEAVFEVAGEYGGPALIAALPSLADTQLIQSDPSSPAPRMRMLEPVRMFALNRVEAAGEARAVRRAHAEHYLAWARAQSAVIGGRNPMPGLDALDADLANLLAAVDVACRSADPALIDAALLAIASITLYWEVRTRFREGRATLAAALAAADTLLASRPEAVSAESLMEAVWAQGYLAYLQADAPELHRAWRRLEPIAEASGDPEQLARARMLATFVGALEGAPMSELVEIASRAHATAPDRVDSIAWPMSLLLLGNLCIECGDLESALPCLTAYAERARSIGREIDIRGGAAWLGLLLVRLGRREEARKWLVESLVGSELSRPITTLAWSMLGIAAAIVGPEANPEELRRAALLLGAYDSQLEEHGLDETPQQEALSIETRAAIAAIIGAEHLEELLEGGRDLRVDEVLELARA